MHNIRIASILFSCLSAVVAQEALTIAGSTTVRPIVDKVLTSFRKEHAGIQVSVDGGGSSRGIAAAGKGEVAIGMASRAPKEKDKKDFPDLVFHKVGIDGLSIVVHKENAVKNITKSQLADVFMGKITNWKQLGGADAEITPISLTTNHGTYEAFAEFLEFEGKESEDHGSVTLRAKGMKEGGFTVKAVDGNRAALGGVIANRLAIVCVSTGAAQAMKVKGAGVSILTLDGVEPSEKNLHGGEYKFQRPLFLITKGEPQGAAKAFIGFVQGTAGQRVIQAMDFVPATPVK